MCAPHTVGRLASFVFLAFAVSCLAASQSIAAWPPDGLVIGGAGSLISSDGAGGLFALDGNPYSVTGQVLRFTSDGNLASEWPAAGVELVAGNTYGAHAGIAAIAVLPDGDGGTFVLTYERGPYPGSGGFLNPFQYYLHRRTSTGAVASGWPNDGVLVETEWQWPPAAANNLPAMADDGRGGVLITWATAVPSPRRVLVQRVSGDGTRLWGNDGVIARASDDLGSLPSVTADGHGGAIVTWAEWNASATQVAPRGQHLAASGDVLWGAAGRQMSAASFTAMERAFVPSAGLGYSPHLPAIRTLSDGEGGALLFWSAVRGGDLDLCASRVSSAGASVWKCDLAVCSGPGDVTQLACAPASGRTAVVVWRDLRDPAGAGIYAQEITTNGRVRWRENGVAVATGAGDRNTPATSDDGREGVYVSWADASTGGQVLVQRLGRSGSPTVGWPEGGKLVSQSAHSNVAAASLQLVGSDRGSVILGWSDVLGRAVAMKVTPEGPASAGPVASNRPTHTDAERLLTRSGLRLSAVPGGSVRFALPAGEHATLEVIDLSGRRVLTQEVGGASGGSFEVDLAQESDIRAGIYFVRLQLGTQRATTRVAVLR